MKTLLVVVFALAFAATSATVLGQQPPSRAELVVQTGHSELVTSVAFSPDGRTLASGSWDNTIKLWDAATGRELRTLRGHKSSVSSVAFSVDGKTLATGGGDSVVKLWDVASGKELRTFTGHDSVIGSVAFSPNGRILATGSWDKTIKFWDLATGAELLTITEADEVRSMAFSPDGKTLVSGTNDKTLKLWDTATGRLLRIFSGHTALIFAVAISPDGKILASGSGDFTVKLWDSASGNVLHTLTGRERAFQSVAFSPNGKTLAGASDDRTIRIWDVASGRELRTLEGHSRMVTSVAFSPDGKTLASGSEDRSVRLWDAAGGKALNALAGQATPIDSVAISPNGKWLAHDNGTTVKLWDLTTGREPRSFPGRDKGISAVALSNDGKTLASGDGFGDHAIRLWDIANGVELRTLSAGYDGEARSIAFNRDGTVLAAVVDDDTLRLWEVSTGRELRSISTEHTGGVSSVAFSPDGKTLASASKDPIKLWDVATGQERRTLSGHLYEVRSVAFSPDGRILASGGSDATVKLWDVTTGQELRSLTGSRVEAVAFSPDGKIVAGGGMDTTVRLWNVADGSELRTLTGHSNLILSLAFSPDGKTLFTGSNDATIKLWDVSERRELASLVALDHTDWLVSTPDGLFDGSPAAWDRIHWRFNNNTFDNAPVEAYFNEYYYPGLLTDIYSGKRPQAPSDISQKDRRQPQLKLAMADAGAGSTVTARMVTVRIDISQALAGAQDVRLFRNGSLVKEWHGDVLKGQSTETLATKVPIVAGENRLTAYAFNRDNIKSADASLVVNGGDSLRRKGTMFIVALGIDQYANPAYTLKYAVADAEDFSGEVRARQAALGQYERVEVVALYNRDATKGKILAALNGLTAKVQPEDAIIVYFAGHGAAFGNRFYLVPQDLGYSGARDQLDQTGLDAILAHSISDEELQAAVEGIDAGQMLMVIDACNSGQALEAEEKRRGPMNSKGLAQLAYEKGMYILTAAQSYQAALEASKLGHGYLTYALVEEGLKSPAADTAPKDGSVYLREWLDYATARVPAMQQEKLDQSKQTPKPTTPEQARLLLQQTVAFTNGEESIDPAQRTLQRPRVFYRREEEPQPLVIARP